MKINKLKPIVVVICLLLGISGAMAQSDSFFNYQEESRDGGGMEPAGFNQSHNGIEPAPLGSGLLLLAGMGAFYAFTRRKENEK